ncbi:diaminopimelate decarboxylase [Halorientalis persicus]|uniref:Diaminopimelate decarboxylase n=1 Tax=Halorientalis persicus TaxID=1367881 RepID=A0A1H8EVF1_9EURY|nr:diaminopimelate decarboxylase [Halorientalis persicus]SEN23453.1 diaminopimelate decarboxylase [Halorientalis persicus]
MNSGSAVRRLSAWDAERLRSLAAEYDTPLYVYDLERVRENAARLQRAFDSEEISYAVKANTTRPVLSTIDSTGVGAECASAGEVERALAAGFDGADVRYTAVNPPARDLDYVVDAAADEDLIVTVGAADTLDQLAERGFSGRLCIRANPGVGAGHHEKVSTGAAPKFGVPLNRVPELASEAVDRGFDLVGLHAHAGSGISGEDLEAHRELVARMGELARSVIADVGSIEFVNVGGGLGVPYREDEAPLDLDAVARATREAFGDVDARLGIEPGRYFVADAGVLLTRVNTVKPTPETTVVGVDAGMTTLVRPAMYDSYHAIRSLVPDAGDRETVSATVAGPICETADVLGEDRPLPDPEREDLLAVDNAGAYGYEMSSNYNSRPRPAVVALDGDETQLAVRREAVADITERETWSE